MLHAVRFSLMERSVLQRLSERLAPCPLRHLVAAALHYHGQQLWQPVLQSPLTQPRCAQRCLLAFGGMYESPPPRVGGRQVFLLLEPTWSAWRTLPAGHAPRMSNQGVAVLHNFIYLVGGDNNACGFRAETSCWR